MKLKIRMEKANSKHVHCSVFSDENDCGTYALLGKLVMTRREYRAFTYVLKIGAECTRDYELSFDNLEALEKVITEFEKKEKER